GGGNGDDNGDDNGSGSGDGNGDDDSDDNNETTTPPRDDNQKQALPTTGIEGDVFLWLALLALTIIVGLCVVAKVRGSKE
ncbi:MAG: hypothetical protein FWD05_14355, partial [Oscillospiraceae bacterium]|nr:hypothetical protein [Oscillospiraceae bacterium]